jgi:hypothetical protein
MARLQAIVIVRVIWSMDATKNQVMGLSMVRSKPCARRQLRLKQAIVFLTTLRRCRNLKLFAASQCLMISNVHLPIW